MKLLQITSRPAVDKSSDNRKRELILMPKMEQEIKWKCGRFLQKDIMNSETADLNVEQEPLEGSHVCFIHQILFYRCKIVSLLLFFFLSDYY